MLSLKTNLKRSLDGEASFMEIEEFEALTEFEKVKLKDILNHVYNHTAYYRRVFESIGKMLNDI